MKKIIAILTFCFLGNIFSQDTLIFTKNYIPEPDTTLVFYPDNFNKNNSTPLLILLHGWSGNYKQWSEITDLQQASNKYNFVIVTPDGFYDSWYVNSLLKPNVQFESFFYNDLLPKIFNDYNIDSGNVFISGLSMGGHGAITLFLKNPELFTSAASTSGILNLLAFPDRWTIKGAIGSIKDYPDEWKQNSALQLLERNHSLTKPILIDCGTEDFSYNVNKQFYNRAKELKLNIKFISQPGNHNKKYWAQSILQHLEFFKSLVKIE